MTTISCKNCGQKFKGNFCNHCGQSAHTHDLGMAYFWHEIQHGVFHIDKGILYTTRELFTRPGHAVKDYISGKRMKHFKPFAYLFILSSLYAVIAHYMKIEILLQGINIQLGQDIKINTHDAAEFSRAKEIIQSIYAFLNWIKDHYAYSNLLSLPVFSLATYLSFRKNSYNYFIHLVLNTYIAGQRTVLFLLMLPLIYFINNPDVLNFIEEFKSVAGILLIYWTLNQFFDTNSWYRNILLTLKSFLILLVLMLIIIAAGFTVIALIHS